ncbi:MAG: hypothetical protein MZW92_69930, partial [Comamonadaceae bacterium]|nr:hypothetical protein [Comamonadaceae bacterium]
MPYLAVHAGRVPDAAVQWGGSERGLMPVEATMMVAIPELDGCDRPHGLRRPLRRRRSRRLHRLQPGLHASTSRDDAHDMQVCSERASDAGRARGQAGRAAPLAARRAQGRGRASSTSRPTPATPAPRPSCRSSSRCTTRCSAMQAAGLHGRAAGQRRRAARTRSSTATPSSYGATANVHARIPADDHVRRERWLQGDRGPVGPGAGPPAERRRARLGAGVLCPSYQVNLSNTQLNEV